MAKMKPPTGGKKLPTNMASVVAWVPWADDEIYFWCSNKALWDALTTNHNRAIVHGCSVSQSQHRDLRLSAVLVGRLLRLVQPWNSITFS